MVLRYCQQVKCLTQTTKLYPVSFNDNSDSHNSVVPARNL